MPLFRKKPPLIEHLPAAGEKIVLDDDELGVVTYRRSTLVASMEDTLYNEARAMSVLRSQEAAALLHLALDRVEVKQLKAAAATCVKSLGTWESGLAWYFLAEIARKYGERERAPESLKTANKLAEKRGITTGTSKGYYSHLAGQSFLKEALKDPLFRSLVDAIMAMELNGCIDEIPASGAARRLKDWVALWGLDVLAEPESVHCPSCGNEINPGRGLSGTRYWCRCGFMYTARP